MKYPIFMKKLNLGIARFAGAIIFIVSALAVYEAVARYFFGKPTNWTLNISAYVFIWAIFLGSAYAFQEHGHVAVDLIRDLIDKRTKPSRTVRRVLSIIGYCISFVVITVFMQGGWRLAVRSIELNQMAPLTFRFPLIWVYPSIVAGSVLMLLTLVFIILDLFSKSEEYL